MKKQKYFLIITCFLISGIMWGQSGFNFSNEPGPWRFGGGLGLSMGSNDYFGVSVAPFVGYELLPQLEVGASVGYQYASWRNSKQNLFNFGPYANYYPIPNLFARVQYEHYTGSNKNKESGQKYNFDENALWVGAGYRTPGPVSFYMGLMYDVLYKNDASIFANGFRPIVGVSIGL